MTGLTEEQVKERIEAGQTNADENPNTRTYKQIVKENTLTFFNFLNLVLLVLVLMVGSFKNAFFCMYHHYQYADRNRSGNPGKKNNRQAGDSHSQKVHCSERRKEMDSSYRRACSG